MFVRCSHPNVSTFSVIVSATGAIFSPNVSWAGAMFVRRRCYVFESLQFSCRRAKVASPSGPRGRLRPRVCCVRKLLLPSMVVRRRQDNTPEWCMSTEKLFLFGLAAAGRSVYNPNSPEL
jgi:hypothetical protein